jgi:hypothetical protein
MKTPQELKDEATRLRDKLQNESVIDLNAVRGFWKDLDDYDQGKAPVSSESRGFRPGNQRGQCGQVAIVRAIV